MSPSPFCAPVGICNTSSGGLSVGILHTVFMSFVVLEFQTFVNTSLQWLLFAVNLSTSRIN